MKVFIIAHALTTSGGPELLHQLCNKLNLNGIEAYMVYYEGVHFPCKGPGENVEKVYKEYHCKFKTNIEDLPDNVVLFTETQSFLLPKIKRAKKIIWWLSVDNYFKSLKTNYTRFYAPFGMKGEKYSPFNTNYYHFCQSEYARRFLYSKGIPEEKIMDLSDYISKEFIRASADEHKYLKEDIILYNPAKGFKFTEKLKNQLPSCSWIPLKNFTHTEMIDLMKKSKLYIDFGNHPGKDRIPREAALCGCCIITSRCGAADNELDVPILDIYKYKDCDENISEIIKRIEDIFINYDERRKDFDDYRVKIKGEESVFDKEVEELIHILDIGSLA